jgi:hypothetical protein
VALAVVTVHCGRATIAALDGTDAASGPDESVMRDTPEKEWIKREKSGKVKSSKQSTHDSFLVFSPFRFELTGCKISTFRAKE